MSFIIELIQPFIYSEYYRVNMVRINFTIFTI